MNLQPQNSASWYASTEHTCGISFTGHVPHPLATYEQTPFTISQLIILIFNQTNPSIAKYTNYLLESSSPPAKSKLSSASSSRGPPQPAPDTNNHTDPKSFHSKSGANDTSLFEQSDLSFRRDRSPGDNRPAPPHPPPLLTHTNEILPESNLTSISATSDSQANTDRYTYEAPTQEIVDETEPIDETATSPS